MINELSTIFEGKKHLRDHYEQGVECPCCGQFVKLYKRPIHVTMALALINLYKLGDGYHHMLTITQDLGLTGSGDFAKLRFWGFIDEQPNETDKRTSGFWAITDKGKLFARNLLKVPSSVLLYNNTFQGFEGDHISIVDALKNKFDYQTLINE